MKQAQVEDTAGVTEKELSFLVTGVYAAAIGGVLGIISWFVLNVLATIIAVPICCITACRPCLSGGYIQFAYWFPYVAGGLTTALIWADLALHPETQDETPDQVERA